jgi:DNA-binding transcriptional LysR family regulator
MTILQYKVFLTVTDTGSFTKAGEKLGYTQSAVSQMIRNLEKELDVSLMARSRG